MIHSIPSERRADTDILIVSHMHKALGGAEMAMLEMVEYLSKKGLRLHVVVGMKDSLSDTLTTMGIPFTAIGLPWWVRGPKDNSPFVYSGADPIANTTLQLVELINTLAPKLCVTNTIVVPWLAYAAAITKTPHAWLIHEMGTAGLQLRYDLGEKQTLRTIDLLSDVIFYNSKITAEYYTRQFQHNRNIRLIYPGGKQPNPQLITSPYRDGAFKMVTVGQIKPQKAQLDAIRAIKHLVGEGHNVQLVIIGSDEDPGYVSKLKRYVKRHGLNEAIIFAGYQKNPSSYVSLADIALICSTNEAFGRVTVEAMLLGKPVVGAKSGGTIEIIDDLRTGLYYEPGQSNDLASKIKLLMEDAGLRLRIGKQAEAVAKKRYGDATRYADFLSYFHKLSNERSSLDLSPLGSIFSDFQLTIGLLQEQTHKLELITNSRMWQVAQKVRKITRH